MISTARQAAQINLAAEAILVKEVGQGARFPPPEELQSIFLFCLFLSRNSKRSHQTYDQSWKESYRDDQDCGGNR